MKHFLLSLIFVPILLTSQVQKKYPSLLWKISGNGLKKPSYLYGTMHVSNRVAYYLSEQFFSALKEVDVVGLETNPGDWLDNMEQTGELEELNQLRVPNYGGDFYQSAFPVYFPEKRMLQALLNYDPDILNGLLYRQNKAKENFEESTYIDLFIFQSASKLNKQLISLENFAQSEIKARLSSIPDENESEETANYKNLYANTQKIEDAYRDGNLDMLDSLSKSGSSKNTQRYLIDDRNVFFVNTIDSVLKTKSLFSGVGAAHLPGQNGVIELLRKKGYTVEPLSPNVSKKSHAIRESLDQQIKPVSFKKQFITDSLFSVNLPGKLYPIISLGNLKYYIHADMVNGSFYTVVRLKHLGPLFQVSPDQLMQRMDSLLFENIPGKILSKKEITSNNGIKGLEIVNQTRRGDVQHYQIYFTELELILFKLGGKKDYASSNEAKQFFGSINFLKRSESAQLFTPKNKGFSVKIPGNFIYSKNEAATLLGPIEDLYSYSSDKKQFYGIKRSVYNDFSYLEEDTFELNQFSKNVLNAYNFKQEVKTVIGKELGFPCIRFSASNKQGQHLYAKVFIKGVHYYLQFLIATGESSFEDEFFTSFKLIDFEYTNPIKEITDREFCFKAKDEVTDNALSRFNESYAKAFEASKVKKDSLKQDFDYKSASKLYYSPSSNEYVNITFEKYNDYDFRDVKEVEKKIEKTFSSVYGLVLAKKSSEFKNASFRYSATLKDTATTRAIDIRIFIKNGLMHEISAPYDTTIGLRGWTKGFMNSFQPLDTLVGKNIFENRFENLLNDLCSKDTVIKQMANNSVRSVALQKTFAESFVNFVSGPKINEVNEDSRAQLFVNGGTIENEKIILPYTKLYKQYTDSFYLQLCLLKGLAYLKTQNSYNEFYNLLINEPPLVGSDNTINDVFSVLHDSLELCKKFYPGMLALTKYDEYKEAVYSLMADLVKQKLIAPLNYQLQCNDILTNANLALKRYNSSSAKSSSATDHGNFEHLDKSNKELAENLKWTLEGLENNNTYKGTSTLHALDASRRSALVNYAIILAPLYKGNSEVRQFFDKLSKIKNQSIAMPVYINLLKYDLVLNDSLMAYFCKNKFTAAYFYSELEKEKLSHYFKKDLANQKTMTESVIISQKQLGAYFNYEKEKSKKDSIYLIKELAAHNRYQKGKLFVYKNQKLKNEDETWTVVFIEQSKETISTRVELVNTAYLVDPAKSETENMNELLNVLALQYRKRANTSANSL